MTGGASHNRDDDRDRRRFLPARIAVWVNPLLLVAALAVGIPLIAVNVAAHEFPTALLVFAIVAAFVGAVGSSWVAAIRRERGLQPPTTEPTLRPDRDARGRRQATEPTARLSLFMSPVVALSALGLGGPAAVAFARADEPWSAAAAAGLSLLVVAGCAIAVVRAVRALRSDEMERRTTGHHGE